MEFGKLLSVLEPGDGVLDIDPKPVVYLIHAVVHIPTILQLLDCHAILTFPQNPIPCINNKFAITLMY